MIRKVWVVAAKDLLQLRKDRAALLMMFAVPLLLMAVLGSVFKSADSGSSISATLPVIDHDGGTQGRALIGALRQAPSVHVQLRSNQARVEKSVRDWFEQALVETVIGVQALKDSKEWSVEEIDKALSEEALTATVMSRYHVNNSVKRELGTKLGKLQVA